MRSGIFQTLLGRRTPPADRRFRYGAGPLQFADLRSPENDGPHPCVIAIHGGFWRNTYSLNHLGHLCAALTEQGLATWNIEYRRVGDAGGGWPGTFQDVADASRHVFEHANQLGIDPARISILGHSAGGQLASWLGSMGNIPATSSVRADPLHLRGFVSLAGVFDLREAWKQNLSNGAVEEFLEGTPDEVPDHYAAASPMALIPSRVPHLLIHGDEDAIVPVSMSEAYHAATLGAGGRSTLLTLPDADHFDVIDPESHVWPEIASAILALV